MKRLLLALVLLGGVSLQAQTYVRLGAVISSGAALPSTPCASSQLFYLTSGTVGTYLCGTDRTWALWDNVWTPLTTLTSSAVGLGNVDNTSDANKPVSSATQTALNGKQASGTYATGTGTASGTNTGDQTTVSGNAGTATTLQTARNINGVSFNGSANITVTAAGSTLSDAVTFANGGIGACAATSATTGTMTVSMTTKCVSITPTGACTFNATGGVAGQQISFLITTSGVSSFTLTWGTNYHKTGTLATGTTSARFFAVTFLYDGTNWWEIARTAVQT